MCQLRSDQRYRKGNIANIAASCRIHKRADQSMKDWCTRISQLHQDHQRTHSFSISKHQGPDGCGSCSSHGWHGHETLWNTRFSIDQSGLNSMGILCQWSNLQILAQTGGLMRLIASLPATMVAISTIAGASLG